MIMFVQDICVVTYQSPVIASSEQNPKWQRDEKLAEGDFLEMILRNCG
jgi:hypothetical protein